MTADMAGSDPIADLQAMCERIRRSSDHKANYIVISPAIPSIIDKHADHAEKREKKALRKTLSTRFGQRQRQRAQGVAGIRHDRRQMAKYHLAVSIPQTREMAAAMRGEGLTP